MEDNILLLIVFIRLLIPLTVMIWPLGGATLSILADISDVMLFEAFAGESLDIDYHRFDKMLDMYYLSFFYLVIVLWEEKLVRNIGRILYWWRFSGFILFEESGSLFIFALAPNIFENFYLAILIIRKYFSSYNLTPKRLAIITLLASFPKIIEEYLMHYRYPGQTWNFMRESFFWWMYK